MESIQVWSLWPLLPLNVASDCSLGLLWFSFLTCKIRGLASLEIFQPSHSLFKWNLMLNPKCRIDKIWTAVLNREETQYQHPPPWLSPPSFHKGSLKMTRLLRSLPDLAFENSRTPALLSQIIWPESEQIASLILRVMKWLAGEDRGKIFDNSFF